MLNYDHTFNNFDIRARYLDKLVADMQLAEADFPQNKTKRDALLSTTHLPRMQLLIPLLPCTQTVQPLLPLNPAGCAPRRRRREFTSGSDG